MEMWDYKLPREDRYRNRRENPSFSSTLLDEIYRSIDESSGCKGEEAELIFCRDTTMMRKKHSSLKEKEMSSLQRASMVEKWMEKEKINNIRRKSMEFDDPILLNSSSSSSDSSCGGGFSSSESDSFYGTKSRSSSTSSSSHYNNNNNNTHLPKPIRTNVSAAALPQLEKSSAFRSAAVAAKQNPKSTEGGFVKTKSKALKIYSDLKKVNNKQPISPGSRLASFLNSLFTAGNHAKKKKKAKISSEQATTSISTYSSSASSFSRSCLSKTPSSSTIRGKRSVRFCPVSVILDEYSRPCGHKNINCNINVYKNDDDDHQTNRENIEFRIMEENRRVVEAAKDLLKSYQKKKAEYDDDDQCMRDIRHGNTGEFISDDDEDAASYASSDLFELDNLSAIGIDQRYREELPVYETTHLDTNRAIANGLIV